MITAGPGKFDTSLGGGALIGGERLGLDSGVGVQEGQGLNLGSQLKFGNAPPNPYDPAGQLNQFINNIGYFFQRFNPPPGSISPSSVPRPASLGTIEHRPAPPGTIGVNSGEIPRPASLGTVEHRPAPPGTIGVNSGESTVFETTEFPILEVTEKRITTEGKQRLRPPIPDGFESLESNQ
uniref:Uncharacterized protein n=1 Tax=Panagrolaimus sp. ES5 TaxID=591445 RepID=A0AC34FYL7_9BILA